jgi:hypothetical protein
MPQGWSQRQNPRKRRVDGLKQPALRNTSSASESLRLARNRPAFQTPLFQINVLISTYCGSMLGSRREPRLATSNKKVSISAAVVRESRQQKQGRFQNEIQNLDVDPATLCIRGPGVLLPR